MNILCCLPIRPWLLSDEDIHQRSNFITEQKLRSYTKRSDRYSSFSYYEKHLDEDFDQIFLTDNVDVSFPPS
jgi:hypothetical protein